MYTKHDSEEVNVGFFEMNRILSGGAGNFTLEVFNRYDVQVVVWHALDESEKWQKRDRILAAPLVVWTVVAMCDYLTMAIQIWPFNSGH